MTHPPPPQKSTAVALARRQRIRHRLYGATTLLLFSLLLAHSYRADRSDAASHAITLFADFLKVQGLRAGDPVTLGGVTIGKVTKVTLQKPSMNVRVQIAVDDSLAIPSDSSAVIRAQNLSGNMVLVVEAGGEEQTLQEGDFFSFSREPIELPQLITTIAIALGALFLDEVLTLQVWGGFALIAFGLALIDGRVVRAVSRGAKKAR